MRGSRISAVTWKVRSTVGADSDASASLNARCAVMSALRSSSARRVTAPSDATTLSSVDSHVTDAHEGRDRRRERSPRASMEDVSSSASPPSYPTRFDATSFLTARASRSAATLSISQRIFGLHVQVSVVAPEETSNVTRGDPNPAGVRDGSS